MRILECPPRLSDEQGYVDEADQFFMNPSSWLIKQYGNSLNNEEQDHLPTHIVMYNALLPVSYLCYCFICQCEYNIVAKIIFKKIQILRLTHWRLQRLDTIQETEPAFFILDYSQARSSVPPKIPLMNLLLIRKLNHG